MLQSQKKFTFLRLIFGICILISLGLYSQNTKFSDNPNKPLTNNSETETSEAETSDLGAYKDPIKTYESSSVSYVWLMIKTLLILGVFIGVFIFLYKYSQKKSKLTEGDTGLIELLYDFNLGVNKKINVVKIVNEYYLLGVTQDGITMLGQITDKDAIDQFKIEHSKPKGKGNFFQDILSKYLKLPKSSPLGMTRKIRDKIDGLK